MRKRESRGKERVEEKRGEGERRERGRGTEGREKRERGKGEEGREKRDRLRGEKGKDNVGGV